MNLTKNKSNFLITYEDSSRNPFNEINTFIKELSFKMINEMNISRKHDLTYLELKYPSPDANQDSFNKFFDSASVHARLYKRFIGCQVIDITDWINETLSNRFNELLTYLRKNSQDSRFVIIAQVSDVTTAKRLAAVLSTALDISLIFYDKKHEELTFKHIVNDFSSHNVKLNSESKKLIQDWIEQQTINVFLNQPNGVKLLVKAILNNIGIERLNTSNHNHVRIVTKQNLLQFEINVISYINKENNTKRKIGF